MNQVFVDTVNNIKKNKSITIEQFDFIVRFQIKRNHLEIIVENNY